jgi:hypothetical protein
MAFSFGVEMMNMWMRRREKVKKPVELREPHLQPRPTGTMPTPYDDQAK